MLGKPGKIKDAGIKTDNNPRAHAAKVAIRAMVLEAIGPDTASVFDAFAGAGEMHSAVWRHAKDYTGCDQKWQRDGRKMFCADNRRVMRSIKLTQFNVFDLDSYGSPWEQAIIIADRRPVKPGELIGVALTEGSALGFNVNAMATGVRIMARLNGRAVVGQRRNQDAILERCISQFAKRMRCDVVHRWQADGKSGAAMRYIGLVLKGRATQ